MRTVGEEVNEKPGQPLLEVGDVILEAPDFLFINLEWPDQGDWGIHGDTGFVNVYEQEGQARCVRT